MTRTLLILLAAILMCPGSVSAAVPALLPGEQLTYTATWGILSPGEIKIAASQAPEENGNPRLSITTTTETKGVASWVYKLTVRGESIFDQRSSQLLRLVETSKEPRKETNQTLTFDYAKKIVRLDDKVEPHKSADLALPAGEPLDLIMALVQTRSWDLKVGEKRDSLVIFDGEFYELTIHAEKEEEILINGKWVKTLRLVPRMEKTPPKGMFKRGSTVKVWISQDARRLPVRFQVDMKVVGAITATLSKHTPPPALAATSAK